MKRGRVLLIGAGPGDVNLITAKALDALRRAQAVVFDRLVNPELLQLVSPLARRFDVGKTPGQPGPTQEEICELLIEQARLGRTVARLKGGDPFVFGRGGEEILALLDAGIPFEVIPGITAGIAAPACAGIPVTHRGLASMVTFVTGQVDPARPDAGINWQALAATGGTLVFYMGVKQLPNIVRNLLDAGLAPDTPAAVIEQGTTPRQRSIRSSLGAIAEAASAANISPPAVTVIGKVAGLPAELNWFERLPLFGRRIVVTRAAEQADTSADVLASLGAEPILFPTIEIASPTDTAPLDGAIESIASFPWIVLTSANAVIRFMERLFEKGRDARTLADSRIACMGPVTADTLAGYGLRADLVPAEATGKALAKELASIGDLAGKRLLLPRSDIAREELLELLRQAGAEPVHVTTYLTRTNAEPDPQIARRLRAGEFDAATFTSPSTVRGFLEILGPEKARSLRGKAVFGAIGSVTGKALRDAGMAPVIEASDHTFEGLVDLLCGRFGGCPRGPD